jgi:hypothetical protein
MLSLTRNLYGFHVIGQGDRLICLIQGKALLSCWK